MEITKETVLRAWRDEDYAKGLPEDVRKAIPAKPEGKDGQALSDAELENAAGGTTFAVTIATAGVVGTGAGWGVGELVD